MSKTTPTKAEIQPATVPAGELTPLDMLDRAVETGANIEVLERLMGLSERWQSDQARRAFAAALSDLRANLPPIIKNRVVDFTTQRGRTHYKYEDLAEMTEALSPAMAQHGLSFRWRTDSTQKGLVSVTCIVEHRDGHAEETTLAGPYDESGNKNPIQAIGSVVTYLQRYTLKAAIGIAAAQDDDGQAAGAPVDPGRRAPEKPAKPQPGRRQEPQGGASGTISEAQRKRAFALIFGEADKMGMDKDAAMDLFRSVLGHHGIEHTDEIPRDLYDQVIDETLARINPEPGDDAA